jgi:hypothetical protein
MAPAIKPPRKLLKTTASDIYECGLGIKKPELTGGFEVETLLYEQKESINQAGRCFLMICYGYLVLRLLSKST